MLQFHKIKWKRDITWMVFLTLVLSLIYSVVKMAYAPAGALPDFPHEKVKSDYVLMLLQCIIGLAVMFVPSAIEKRLKIIIPNYMHIIFIIFLYAAIYLGEVRDFYYIIPHWDTVLHIFSGAMLGALGFSVVSLLNSHEKVKIQLSPIFLAVFAFSFALCLGVIWEIYEFAADGVLQLNMQKYALENGVPLVGRMALTDTMADLIVDGLGALAMTVFGLFSLKYHKGWIK